MGVYLRAKFQVSNIILTSFRHKGVILLSPHLKTNSPKKGHQR